MLSNAVSLGERRRGGLWGLLVGDALGVPYEFHSASAIPSRELIDMVPPVGFDRTYPDVPAGTWSDDGATALALLDSLHRRSRLDLSDLAGALLDWRDHGRYAVDGHTFDVGGQTNRALDALVRGVPAEECGGVDERSNGNGSLMRALSLSLWHLGKDKDLIEAAAAQSLPTHAHPRAQVCCMVFCGWSRRLLYGGAAGPSFDEALHQVRDVLSGQDPRRTELDRHLLPALNDPIRGTGYVVHSLLAARHLLIRYDEYADVVRAAVALGDDTDTTAAIAGGLAGIRAGEHGIPMRWREMLRGQDILAPFLMILDSR
ncbi:ADP-ribosylarginine hydrolase Tri1 [Austwickia sp. TVS 96-490-7B]|uniref:ADP-ribosylglycohydrolase family protein n=1 Tax=Austwickia sp. TVS 96-490-7B TaxID=2830843 RepID=UPI001C55E661|nr:ADP-ribosylglycohydrolase family protein [Austwickia sp. TVS 96-490-7B]MBW3086750.1 ADP-ribosylarginine hydrolase Tri1 [Austwickia sp. TVS 96-490-7B]